MNDNNRLNRESAGVGHSEVTIEDVDWYKIYDRQNEHAWLLCDTTTAVRQ
jgi:hypothetical protein